MASFKKIESLTPAQEAALVAYRQEWLAIGRSTEPADRPTAERAVARMYELMGRKQPYFWWCDGPAVGSLVRTILQLPKDDKTQNNLGANLYANLGANLYANLRDNLGANLGDNLYANLGANLGAILYANLGDNLRDNLYANLGDNL